VADEGRDAAGGIAAGACLAAIRVVDAHEDIRAIGARFEADELVAADPAAPVREQADALGRQAERPRAPVQHDEVIARPVHLDEGDLHGPGYRCRPLWPEER
jgi:hypothetical protein